MGRGDSRTRKGKIFKGSYGNVRPKSKNEKVAKGSSSAKTTGATKPKAAPATKPSKKKS